MQNSPQTDQLLSNEEKRANQEDFRIQNHRISATLSLLQGRTPHKLVDSLMKFLAEVSSCNIFFLHLSYRFQKCKQNFCSCLDLGGPVALGHKNPPNSAEWAVSVMQLSPRWGPHSYRTLDNIFGITMIDGEKKCYMK